jgi:hypothetical protein
MRWSALLVVLLVAACADTGAREPAQREFAVPDRMLGYTYSGATYRPIPNTGTGMVGGSSLQSAY